MKKIVVVLMLSLLVSVPVFAGSVTLDHTDGTWSDGGTLKIQPGCDVSFYIRINNTDGPTANAITNGFKLYGPSTFDPPTVEIVYPGFEDFFDLVFAVIYFSVDGFGADTIGLGGSKLNSTGLPEGFNEVTYKITSGNIPPGEILCLDSAFYPPTGLWQWAPGGTPSWDGPHCFISETSGPEYFISNPPGTITAYACDTIQYDFDAFPINPGCLFKIIEGPGIIDSITGNWFFIAGVDDINIIDTLIVGVNGVGEVCSGSASQVILNLLDSEMPGDLNQSCTVDVGDLVFLVNYMFAGGPPPPFEPDGDVNGDDTVDIGDLVYLVNYMFAGGPPPVDPPPIG